MKRIGDFLGNVIRGINHPEATLAWLESSWPAVVGPRLAAHTHPLRCVGARLELCADSQDWQAQLADIESDLRKRINAAWGGTLVREEKFVPSSPPRPVCHERDNSHTPFIRRRRSPLL
jgi:predicted nucleic acid-binding Zn ribbon protein